VAHFPDIPFAAWKDTLATLHRFAQIVLLHRPGAHRTA
jgi:hypothetical protein